MRRIDDRLAMIGKILCLGALAALVWLAVGCSGGTVMDDDESDYWRAMDRARFEAALRCAPPPRCRW